MLFAIELLGTNIVLWFMSVVKTTWIKFIVYFTKSYFQNARFLYETEISGAVEESNDDSLADLWQCIIKYSQMLPC